MKIPEELTGALNDVCGKLGLRKKHVIETALREKIENITAEIRLFP